MRRQSCVSGSAFLAGIVSSLIDQLASCLLPFLVKQPGQIEEAGQEKKKGPSGREAEARPFVIATVQERSLLCPANWPWSLATGRMSGGRERLAYAREKENIPGHPWTRKARRSEAEQPSP